MQRHPMTTSTDDWEFSLNADLRKFGQVVMLATLQSRSVGARRMAAMTSLDGAALWSTLGRAANPLVVIRSLLGTSSGPITSSPWFPCHCERLFSLAQLDHYAGHARGFTAGASFGYCYLTFVAPGLFSVQVQGITASVMFPSIGTVSGRWFLLGNTEMPAAPLLDAPDHFHRNKSTTV